MRRVLLAVALVVAGLLTYAAPAAAAPYCGIEWGSGPKAVSTYGTGEVDNIRTGRHDCWDRVVVEVDGPAAGYRAEYVDTVHADGSGAVVAVPGGAKIRLIVNHPASTLGPVGSSQANVSGYSTLRSVVNAGSFEGQTTIGVGTRARLPFRVFVLQGGHGRIVLDVAHRW